MSHPYIPNPHFFHLAALCFAEEEDVPFLMESESLSFLNPNLTPLIILWCTGLRFWNVTSMNISFSTYHH